MCMSVCAHVCMHVCHSSAPSRVLLPRPQLGSSWWPPRVRPAPRLVTCEQPACKGGVFSGELGNFPGRKYNFPVRPRGLLVRLQVLACFPARCFPLVLLQSRIEFTCHQCCLQARRDRFVCVLVQTRASAIAAGSCAQGSREPDSASQSSVALSRCRLLLLVLVLPKLTCEVCGRLCKALQCITCSSLHPRALLFLVACPSRPPSPFSRLALFSPARWASHLQAARGQVRCARSAAPSYVLPRPRACWIHLFPPLPARSA